MLAYICLEFYFLWLKRRSSWCYGRLSRFEFSVCVSLLAIYTLSSSCKLKALKKPPWSEFFFPLWSSYSLKLSSSLFDSSILFCRLILSSSLSFSRISLAWNSRSFIWLAWVYWSLSSWIVASDSIFIASNAALLAWSAFSFSAICLSDFASTFSSSFWTDSLLEMSVLR